MSGGRPVFFDKSLETMPPAERAAFEGRTIREAVGRAYESAPAFRKAMDGAGIRPEEVRDIDGLARVPLTRKADLMAIQRRDLPFGGLAAVPPREMRRIYVSPGPIYDPEGREEGYWRWEKAFVAAGFRPGDIVQNTFAYHFSPAGLMCDEALQRIGCAVVPAGVGNTELQVQVLRELGVTGYVGTPSFLMTLLEKAREAGAVPGDGLALRVAMAAAEMLPESLRTRFREEFRVEVRQCYATADAGVLGYECSEASGMHIPDEIVMELLDPVSGRRTAPGEIGEVVVTLPRRSYPLVRFATGDLSIRDDAPCPCGRTSPRLLKLAGRVDQVTKVRGLFIHPEQVAQAEKRVEGVAALQIVVTRDGHEDRMTVLAVPAAGAAGLEGLGSRIAEAVREVTRLRGEVAFVSEAELCPRDKKIVDRRKWD